ncbi:MAG: flagellar basal body P-ring protein FlgI [Phycisphaerales bacterium]|nr:flagellar basal body P-ring protein FlgI [Phycisphaerales bacterium]
MGFKWPKINSILSILALGNCLALTACDGIERTDPGKATTRANAVNASDLPPIMRGTVGEQTRIVGYSPEDAPGYQPLVVRGYGLVVGLNDTGSQDSPAQVRAHMIAEMSRLGVGQTSMGLGHISPEKMLDSKDTAVVLVEGVIPQASTGRHDPTTPLDEPQYGTRFDVRVSILPGSSTTSLSGGRLYTTELRPGPLRTGSRQARALAQAHGDLFVNPFIDPDESRRGGGLTVGTILNGGEVLTDMPLKLILNNPSHARATMIRDAINRRFPMEPGQSEPTSRGISQTALQLTVPPSQSDDSVHFIELVRHTTLRHNQTDRVADSTKRYLVANPSYTDIAAWRWEALGERSVPAVRELYDHPQEPIRMTALTTGAKLQDATVIDHLIEVTQSGAAQNRLDAILLFKYLPFDPSVNQALYKLLDDDDVDIRLAAYEILAERNDPRLHRRIIAEKFILDVVPSKKPMIYIAQTGFPRIAIFSDDLQLVSPVLFNTWANRLMIKSLSQNAQSPSETSRASTLVGTEEMKEDSDRGQVEVFFRASAAHLPRTQALSNSVADLTIFLGSGMDVTQTHPGLDLTYGQTINALHSLWREQAVLCDFKAEQDRILAEIRRNQRDPLVTARPDFNQATTSPGGRWVSDVYQPTPLNGPTSDQLSTTPGLEDLQAEILPPTNQPVAAPIRPIVDDSLRGNVPR